MICPKCIRQLHSHCETKGGCSECHPAQKETTESSEIESNPFQIEESGETDSDSLHGLERSGKLDSSLKDPQSTGRKRAAKQYPLNKSLPCEWRGILHAGGGTKPIMGCVAGKQQARHHGPDYNTLNNEPGNVHRICHSCHNRWHAENDKFKDESYLKLYGIDVRSEDLSKAAKELKSGGYQTKGSSGL